MGKERLSQTLCSKILLIALAIQGITPDANDLSSINALKLVCPVLTDSDQPVDEDDFPDDVCVPLRIELDLGVQHLANSDTLPFPKFTTTEAQPGTMKCDVLRFVSRHGTLTPIAGRIHRLSPLIC
jgi:hypothetical protein